MSTPLKLSRLTQEYLKVSIAGTVDGIPVDVAARTVEFALPLKGEDPVDWIPGSWEEYEGATYARFLFGQGGFVVADPGTYVVWVRLTDSPEIPVRTVGELRVF